MNKMYRYIILLLLITMGAPIYSMEQGSGGGKKEIEEPVSPISSLLTDNIIAEIRSIIGKSSSVLIAYQDIKEFLRWQFPQGILDILSNNEFKKWLINQFYEKFIPAADKQKDSIAEDDFYKAIKLIEVSGEAMDEAYEKFHQWLGAIQGKELLRQLIDKTLNEDEEKVKLLTDLINYIKGRSSRGKIVIAEELPPLVEEGSAMPLDIAVMKNNPRIVQMLINTGYSLNIKGAEDKTALHRAAQLGNYQLAQFLIQNGADVNVQDDDGYTPLQLAIEQEEYAIIQLLIDNGANPNILNSVGNSAFDTAQGDMRTIQIMTGQAREY